jgi:acyl-coenzyme A thioesterase PaaI-like protein
VRHFKLMEIIVVLESELIEQGWETRPTMGFNELVGPIWARRDGDVLVNGFLVMDKHLNFRRNLHGGMLATFADSVLGRMVFNAVKPRPSVTIQLNMHYVGPVTLGDFVAGRGEIVRTTGSVVFVAGRFTVGSSVVATADGIWKILNVSQRSSTEPDPRPPERE